MSFKSVFFDLIVLTIMVQQKIQWGKKHSAINHTRETLEISEKYPPTVTALPFEVEFMSKFSVLFGLLETRILLFLNGNEHTITIVQT